MDAEKVFRREATLTDWVARHAWGKIKKALPHKFVKRCAICILPETHSPLNKDGICPECEGGTKRSGPATPQDDPHRSQWTESLHLILQSACHSGGGAYDALLLFSGGKDSTYMLKQIQEQHPTLRLLLLLVDNGFLSPIAVNNAKSVIQHFDVDFVHWKLNPRFVAKVFRTGFLNLHLQKNYSLIDLLDGQMTFDTARILASKLEIPLVLCGLGRTQLENVFGSIGFEMTEKEEANPFESQAGLHLEDLFSDDEVKYWFHRGSTKVPPRFLMPLVAWGTGENEVLEHLRPTGLISSHHTSPLLTNNQIIPLIGIVEVRRFGFSTFEVEFAKTIRQGQADRTYWLNIFQMLEYSAHTGHFMGATFDSTLSQLDLTRQQLGLRE
ncbi:MAG: hypothetical protein H6626_03665 [Pseudobdellovibrionaceae bacterium]|nr:hypothetical protein [Bdellovibrionales bacterium]USN48197.1 MAG: hypothetical protein H6626_03665 [Pseudobdellovibrionaceae bacterium]